MKKSLLWAMVSMAFVAFTACEPLGPNTPEKIPASFPKKHLIEEFTGQGCKYCPDGMDAIHEFMGNDTNWVLILHHAGFSDDHFTIRESKTIASKLKVSSAPSADIDRATTNYGAGNAIIFHPGYLSYTNKSQFDTETYASIDIKNEYNAATRELTVRVNGLISKKDFPQLKLTVAVKESGMIDTQEDAYNTFEGWEEFRHTNAVRAFLTAAEGVEINVVNQRYSDVFSVTLKDNWVPENCMVVAFLTEDLKPVVQAEQKPVVDGTKGGADITHGGIKPVEVPSYYPEPSATNGPSFYSGNDSIDIATGNLFYQKYPSYGFTYWCIQAYSADASVNVMNTPSVPFTDVYFFTDIDVATNEIPVGTYSFLSTAEPGTAEAGYRDDDEFQIGGSSFYFISKSYFNQGYLVPTAQWLIADGTLTITTDGWSISGHTLNGASINCNGTGPLQIAGSMGAPKRIKPKGQGEFLYCE